MCMGMEFPWEWEHKYAEMGMGIEHLTMRMATFSCMQWRINHDANNAMAWGPPLKGAPRAAV